MRARRGLSKEQRKVLWDKLWERDRVFVGGTWRVRCKFCGRFVAKNRKVTLIDHIDNDPTNDELSNRQLIHRRCNYLKDPRGKRPIESPREDGDDDQMSGELRKNRVAEPLFIRWMLDFIRKNGPQQKDALIDAGAYVANISTVTAERYLRKQTSSMGPLMFEKNNELGVQLIRFRDGRHALDEPEL
jgi:hypothetical protein